MSLFTFIASPARCAFLSDTDMVTATVAGRHASGSLSKLWTFPHLSGVIGGRGVVSTYQALWHKLYAAGYGDWCEVLPHIAAALEEAHEETAGEREAAGLTGDAADVNLVAFGYSRERGECLCAAYQTGGAWGEVFKSGVIAAPVFGIDMAAEREKVTAPDGDNLLRIAKRQHRNVSPEDRANYAIGGNVTYVELDAAGLRVAVHPPLEELDHIPPAGGAPFGNRAMRRKAAALARRRRVGV